MLELNEVVLKGERQTLSLMAYKGRLTCLTGGTAERRRRWLYAMMGFEPAQVGVVCVDGEPLTDATAAEIRALMGFVPHELKDEGEVRHYEAPSVQDVFRLRANRHLPISNGILAEEMRRTGVTDDQARWLAVAVLLDRQILLVDSPVAGTADYLLRQARSGRTVIAATDDESLLRHADEVVTLTD